MYSSHSNNPPQPEWRLPTPTPAPPTTSPHSQPSWQHEVPSPTTSPPSYTPGTYGTIPTTSGVDTTAWGVRYNQQQHSFSPPPLPPRPSGTTEPTYGRPYSPVGTAQSPNKPLPAAPITVVQSPAGTPAYALEQTGTPVPSHPSPVSSAYQQQSNQTWQQPLYSNPPAYNPQPQPSTVSPIQPCPPRKPEPAPPPVPPKTSHNVILSGSALGSGSPSDWEHFTPTPGHINDMGSSQPQREDSPKLVPAYGSPGEHSPAISSPVSVNQVPISTPPPVSLPAIQTSDPENQPSLEKLSTSPVSPERIQEQNSSRPVRVDSLNTNHSTVSSEPHETIDGVIDAWNQPLSPAAKPSRESSRQSSRSGAGGASLVERPSPVIRENQASLKGQSDPQNVGNRTPPGDSAVIKFQDPYDDLDPWFKSSLTRYVAMLRKEAVADSDQERFKIFTAFVSKEAKLREILYNIEPAQKSEGVQPTSAQPSPKKTTATISPVESGLIPVEVEDPQATSDDCEEGRYSPGGRPILPRLHTPTIPNLQRSASHATGRLQASNPETGDPVASSTQPRSTSVPPSMGGPVHNQPLEPLTTNPPQPIYTPFRYTEGPQRGSDNLAFDRPAYQAYSALRQASAESGRVMSNPSATGPQSTMSPTPAIQNNHDETFIGLIRAKSVTYRKNARRTSSPPPLPASLRRGAGDPIDDLRSLVSAPLAKQSESSWHVTTRKSLEKYGDDFSYVQDAFKSWETATKGRREKLDRERMGRQEESEHNIDVLFNEKEIGYADINTLEEEFRQTEARVQLDEERQELDNFIVNVFDPLDKRLNEEISVLQTHYDTALSQLDHENSKIRDLTTEKYNLSYTMKLVNGIHRKLEARYSKRLEIALDRERRRKKAERRPLVFMGDSPALRQLDGDFDRMEKRNIVEAARDRDERANRLMDSFDDAIMHGLGENQSHLDEVSTKASKIDAAAIRSSGLPESEVEQMLTSVFTLVESLRQDSESILHSFGIADSALNDADYSVSVAEARYSNSEPDVFRKLGDEKKKEDAKIQSELESKLESVRNGPAEITATINKLLEVLGKDPMTEHLEPFESITGHHPVDILFPGPRAVESTGKAENDSEHQERLRKALEDAKKRNAARNMSLSQG